MEMQEPWRLHHYVIGECIDRGGMGEVFRAQDTRLMRPVAIKFLKGEVAAADATAVLRFLREARAASALNHPNIVIIHEVGETDSGAPFLVQELIDGRTLRSLLDGPATVADVAEIGRQVARALAAAHARGITHRDVKPENIMVRADGLVKVLDFGLARHEDPSAVDDPARFETELGLLVGTPSYLSPEQAAGGSVSSAGDVFSLGVVLYEMLVGTPPFRGSSPMSVVAAVITSQPAPLTMLRPDVPRALTDLVHQMLEKEPERRPSSADVDRMLGALLGAGAGIDGLAASATTGPVTVGRARERDQLLRSYVAARDQSARMVAVTGEPGIGKSSLVEQFLSDLVLRGEQPLILRGHCSESLAGSEAYLPVLEALDGLRGTGTGESLDVTIRSIAPTWYAQLSTHSERAASERADEPRPAPSSERMKRELSTLLEEVSRTRPIVLVIDDLHWADVSTIDMLNYLAGRFPGMRVLILTGYRPSDMALTAHPFLGIRTDLLAHGVFEEIALDFLQPDDVAAYLELQFPGHAFPPDLARIIHERTEGSPLFMGDLIRYLRDTGGLVEDDGTWSLAHAMPVTTDGLPSTVRAMILRKIGRVDAEDRALLEAAALQGREFDSAILGESMGMDMLEVEDRLDRLENVHVLIRQIAESEFPDRTLTLRYQFIHVLYQNVLYESLRPTRRVTLASRIAAALHAHHDTDPAAVAGRLALLHETAREFEQSAGYFLMAAQKAITLFGYAEALALAERGIQALTGTPQGPTRLQLELGLQLVCAHALRSLRGWASPELERTFARAAELCQQLNDPPELFPVMWNVAFFNMIRGDLRAAQSQAAALMAQAEAANEPAFVMAVHHVAGVTCEFLGDVVESSRLLERARELHVPSQHERYNSMFGIDPGMVARAMSSRPLWSRGYPDRAIARCHETIDLGRHQRQPATLVFALIVAQGVHLFRGETADAMTLGDEIKLLCREYEFPQEAEWAAAFQGGALAQQGRADLGFARLQESLDALHALRSGLVRTMFLTLLADAAARTGDVERGLAAVAEGFEHAERTLEGGFIGELHRTRGELLLIAGDDVAAEASLRAAVAYTRDQQARSLELRAATSLAKCLRLKGDRKAAVAALGPVHGWFTEGFTTTDFKAATALLSHIS